MSAAVVEEIIEIILQMHQEYQDGKFDELEHAVRSGDYGEALKEVALLELEAPPGIVWQVKKTKELIEGLVDWARGDDGGMVGANHPVADAAAAGMPELWEGCGPEYSDQVRYLQERLVAIGYPMEVTGTFDHATTATVKLFQSYKTLDPDGVVRVPTWQALLR